MTTNTVISFLNFKGGCSKTTSSCLTAYSLAKKGYKTLLLDLDPQSNATKMMLLTKEYEIEKEGIQEAVAIEKTLFAGIQDKSLENLEVKIMDNLYIIPSYIDFQAFSRYLYLNMDKDEERDYVIHDLIEPLKKQYDYIIIDTMPMSMEVVHNATIASDYIVVALQTQESSLTGAEQLIQEVFEIVNKYDLKTDILGFLPVLWKNGGTVDEFIMSKAKAIFGEGNLFKTVIPQMERIKRFSISGITDRDIHDKRVLEKYSEVANELIKRQHDIEQEDKQ